MPCILRVSLTENAAALAEHVALKPYQISERGDPIRQTGRVREYAYLQFQVSDADFDQLQQQFVDAAEFLALHQADIRVLTAAGEAVLDFGYEPRVLDSGEVAVVQSDLLPQALMRRAVELDVMIELTLYLMGDELFEEEPAS